MYSMYNLKKLPTLSKSAPEATKPFWAYDKAALADGALPKKYKELMAVAVALTTQCAYSIEIHRKSALEAGATETELDGNDSRRGGASGRRGNHAWHAPPGALSGHVGRAHLRDVAALPQISQKRVTSQFTQTNKTRGAFQ